MASDWTVLKSIDREAGVYLSQYIAVRHPGIIKFINPNLWPCTPVSKRVGFDEDGMIDQLLFRQGLDERAAFGVLYALSPDVLGSWASDTPFTGALTANCFNVYTAIEALEQLFTPPSKN